MPSTQLATGGLTLVGVGPGDPELVTVAGVRAIRRADLVAYPVADPAAEGMAATIAARWLRASQPRLPLPFPMVGAAEPRRRAWWQAADRLAAAAAGGARVVFLCEGDVSLFATASYVLLALRQRHPGCAVRLIPGIAAPLAAAAAGAWPLALQQEGLRIVPTPETEGELTSLLDRAAGAAEVLALLKLGRRWSWVRPLLERRGLLPSTLLARRIGWPDEQVVPAAAVDAGALPYFTLLLVRQGWPPVMP